MNPKDTSAFNLEDIVYMKKVVVGAVDPQTPFNQEEQDKQFQLLNNCLKNHPKGKIIGRDVTVATYMIGEHQITMQSTTYHIGFKRKPYWIENEK